MTTEHQDSHDTHAQTSNHETTVITRDLSADEPLTFDYHVVAPLVHHRDTEVRFGEIKSRQRSSVGRDHEYEDGIAVFIPKTELGFSLDAVKDAVVRRRTDRGAVELAEHEEDVHCDYSAGGAAKTGREAAIAELRECLLRATTTEGHPTVESQTDELAAAALYLAKTDGGKTLFAARGARHGGRVRWRRHPGEWWEKESYRVEGARNLEGVEGITVFVPAEALHSRVEYVWASVAGKNGEMAWRRVPDAP